MAKEKKDDKAHSVSKPERKQSGLFNKLLILAVLVALAVAGLFLSNALAPPQFVDTESAANADYFDFNNSRLVSSDVQVFQQSFQPLVCDQGNLVYWRELRVYEVQENNQTKTYSTITLFVKNVGSNSVKNIFVKERLPDDVAASPADLVGFSVKPFAFEKGSVVVNWLFDSIEPGETKSVSYTVEKKLDPKALEDFDSPTAVSQTTAAASAQSQPFDFTLVGLALVVVGLGAVIVFFMRSR